jgi:YVTN family beta-propeller protein
MKRFVQILAIGLSSWMVSACMDMGSPERKLNVNYPAAYVVNGQSSTLSIINLTTNEVADLVQLIDTKEGMVSNSGMFLAYPHHIYLNPAQNQIAIADPGVNLSGGHGAAHTSTAKVLILDAVKGQNIKLIELPMMNHNAIYTPDGKEIWTSQMDDDGKVLIYDATTYLLKNTIKVGKEPAEITFSADGSMAFVANSGEHTVSAINPIAKTVTATIAVGKNPVGAWVGGDNRMYVDNEEGQTVSVIDVKTLKVVETVDLGFMPGYAAFHAETKELWVTDPTAGKVHWWKQNGNGNFEHKSTLVTAAGAHAIAFKGTTAYVTNQEAASVSVIDVTTHTKIKDIKVGAKPNGIVLKF